jgi:hypothetical protein
VPGEPSRGRPRQQAHATERRAVPRGRGPRADRSRPGASLGANGFPRNPVMDAGRDRSLPELSDYRGIARPLSVGHRARDVTAAPRWPYPQLTPLRYSQSRASSSRPFGTGGRTRPAVDHIGIDVHRLTCQHGDRYISATGFLSNRQVEPPA